MAGEHVLDKLITTDQLATYGHGKLDLKSTTLIFNFSVWLFHRTSFSSLVAHQWEEALHNRALLMSLSSNTHTCLNISLSVLTENTWLLCQLFSASYFFYLNVLVFSSYYFQNSGVRRDGPKYIHFASITCFGSPQPQIVWCMFVVTSHILKTSTVFQSN